MSLSSAVARNLRHHVSQRHIDIRQEFGLKSKPVNYIILLELISITIQDISRKSEALSPVMNKYFRSRKSSKSLSRFFLSIFLTYHSSAYLAALLTLLILNV